MRVVLNDVPKVAPTDVDTFIANGGGHGDDAYTAVMGQVGDQVVRIQIHPRQNPTIPGDRRDSQPAKSVTATVANGYYGAWWPGNKGSKDLRLTIYLADGTVLRNVAAFEHNR